MIQTLSDIDSGLSSISSSVSSFTGSVDDFKNEVGNVQKTVDDFSTLLSNQLRDVYGYYTSGSAGISSIELGVRIFFGLKT